MAFFYVNNKGEQTEYESYEHYVDSRPLLEKWKIKYYYSWCVWVETKLFRMKSNKPQVVAGRIIWGSPIIPWWPRKLRWMLRWTICITAGHKGGGTFGYYRCDRCFIDIG